MFPTHLKLKKSIKYVELKLKTLS